MREQQVLEVGAKETAVLPGVPGIVTLKEKNIEPLIS